LADFHQRFNRLTLKVKGAQTAQVKVTWGGQSKVFDRAALEAGVNIAAEFPQGPLKPAFDKIWKAVGDKQAFETRQIKTLFRSPEAKKDMEAVVKSSQVEFDRLAAAVQATLKPVDSTLKVEEVR